MRILYETRLLLNNAEFVTAQPGVGEDALQFEDVNILGEVIEFASVERLLAFWQEQQNVFLKQNAARWRLDPQKAWNIYMVFLTAERPKPEQEGSLLAIEEDFTATRKIARAGVTTKTDLVRALGPILPLFATPGSELEDPEATLKAKLDPDERKWLELALTDASESEIITWLMDTAR